MNLVFKKITIPLENNTIFKIFEKTVAFIAIIVTTTLILLFVHWSLYTLPTKLLIFRHLSHIYL